MSTRSQPIAKNVDQLTIERLEERIVNLIQEIDESSLTIENLRSELNERNITNAEERIGVLNTISKELHIDVGFNRTPDFQAFSNTPMATPGCYMLFCWLIFDI